MNKTKTSKAIENEGTFYDFLSEHKVILTLGNYLWLRKPLPMATLNICRAIGALTLQLYLGFLSIKTIFLTSFNKSISVELLQLLCFMFGSSALHVTLQITKDRLKAGLLLLREERYVYEGIADEQRAILQKRVKQIRFFVAVFINLTICCLFMNIVLVPALRIIFVADNFPFNGVNRHLPLPISMPFRTDTWIGFSFAFISHGICYFFILITFVCHVQTSTSSTLQLCGEFEVLNYSLENIEKRARHKFLKDGGWVHDADANLFEDEEFQNCMFFCLRENIIHHHQILRLKKYVTPYLEISLFTIFLYLSVVIAAAILLITQDLQNNVALVMFLFSDTIGFLQICFVGQLLTNKSGETKLSLYRMPWYSTSKRFKTALNILQIYAQEAIVIRDYGFRISLSLETYNDMISLAYKIVNLLR
nr:olfactory receptor 12 [Tropidothorax elegans]